MIHYGTLHNTFSNLFLLGYRIAPYFMLHFIFFYDLIYICRSSHTILWLTKYLPSSCKTEAASKITYLPTKKSARLHLIIRKLATLRFDSPDYEFYFSLTDSCLPTPIFYIFSTILGPTISSSFFSSSLSAVHFLKFGRRILLGTMTNNKSSIVFTQIHNFSIVLMNGPVEGKSLSSVAVPKRRTYLVFKIFRNANAVITR